MIGRLNGKLAHKQPPSLLIDVAGVGYELEAPMSTFYRLPAVGDAVSLVTHLLMREDGIHLYGFSTRAERQLFRDLLKVSGVGARMALSVLSGISVNDFLATIEQGDSARLTQLPGVGKKIAARLVLEMRDRTQANVGIISALGDGAEAKPGSPETEAFEALNALGYKPAEATRLLNKVSAPGLASEELIRLALKTAVK